MRFIARRRFGALLKRHFDRIACINLDSRPDRWRYARRHFARHGLGGHVRRFSAVDLRNDPQWQPREELQKDIYSLLANLGCILSHRQIVEQARKDGLRSVLVFEDDVKFLEENLAGFAQTLAELAAVDWDLFYLGATYVRPFECAGEHLIRVAQGAFATHAIAYHRNVFDRVLDTLPAAPGDYFDQREFQVNAIDIWLNSGQFDQHRFYGANPMVAVQGLHDSDISSDNPDVENIQKRLFRQQLDKAQAAASAKAEQP